MGQDLIDQQPLLDAEERRQLAARLPLGGGIGRRMVRSDFTVRGEQQLQTTMQGIAYLQRANLRIVSMERDRLVARVAGFAEVVFVHVTMSEATVLWPRDEFSRESATLILPLRGSVEVDGAEDVLTRPPGVTLVLPGTTPLTFRTRGERCEIIHISMGAMYFADLLPSRAEADLRRPVRTTSLAPLLAFIANTCALVEPQPEISSALEPVALEVTRSLLLSTFGRRQSAEPLFSRIHEYILGRYRDPALRIEQVARHLDVSVRTVQVELQDGGTTFGAMLQHARTFEALELIRIEPELPRAEVARRCGFGSVSSLQRALRAVRKSETAE